MGIRQYKPVTPGRRFGSVSDFAELTDRKKKPEKSLLWPLPKTGGRNHHGVVTSRFRGGGHKRRYRLIDFRRCKDGERRYIPAPVGLKAGDRVVSGEGAEPRLGNCLPLRRIPVGLTVHNVELQPGHGGQLGRSAGAGIRLTAREGRWAQITLPSGEVRRVSAECRATIGSVGNADHMNVSLGRAGRKRWLGRKPHNRGTSQNPVSHPMGGGEGRSHGGRHPCSPTGVLAKGGKTRKKGKPSNAAIIRRRPPAPHYAER
jgi:large subunit ribosomal protein L2